MSKKLPASYLFTSTNGLVFAANGKDELNAVMQNHYLNNSI